jgi:hypothetical protein
MGCASAFVARFFGLSRDREFDLEQEEQRGPERSSAAAGGEVRRPGRHPGTHLLPTPGCARARAGRGALAHSGGRRGRDAGRPTSASSRPLAVGSGASARSSTTPPSTAWPSRSPRPGRGADALACLHAAVAEAERVPGIDDLREARGELELADEATGEIIDVVRPRSPSCPTTAPASVARPTRPPSSETTRCCARFAPASAPRRPTASSNASSAHSSTSTCIGHRSTTAEGSRWRPPASATSTTASDPTGRSAIGPHARSTSPAGQASRSALDHCDTRPGGSCGTRCGRGIGRPPAAPPGVPVEVP